ncbi:hypothetical protein QBC39DRAFT_386510 [Podospora conica]|nr:hypothetical protein QBC39DRAFT_386510 [Schizothecium conicum]
MSQEIHDLNIIIIGSKPAGYPTVIHAARASLNPVVLLGGRLQVRLVNTEVENVTGFSGVAGRQRW